MAHGYKFKNKEGPKSLSIIIVIILIVISVAIIFFGKGEVKTNVLPVLQQASIEELSTEGFTKVTPSVGEVTSERAIVSLTGGCYRVSAGTEPLQAESIQRALEGKIAPRPNTHDLMIDIFESLDIKILMVKVVDLRENNFIGRLIIQQGNSIISLDSKPSDGIALAIRTNSTIYFNETLLKQRGENICK